MKTISMKTIVHHHELNSHTRLIWNMRTCETISAHALDVHRTRGVWIPSPPDRRFNIVLSRISYPLRPGPRI